MNRILCMVFAASLGALAVGIWIPFKALVAQEMLELAWAESQARQKPVKPWPWADTWPVARLTLDDARQSLIVLQGGHGESLAFGPGQVFGDMNGKGPMVIAGHRDTHFQNLRNLAPGSQLRLQDRQGQWRVYRVNQTRVVDSRHQQINTATLSNDSLLLVTCYPFNGYDSRGPLRFVVEAQVMPPDTAVAQSQI